MITLYGYDTINTLKVLMFLCEAGLIMNLSPSIFALESNTLPNFAP